MSDVKALDPALLKQYSTDFNADRANLVAANAAVSSGVLAAATDYKGERVLQNDFSIELKQGSITNQRSSGRCWMFAALNTLRYELMHRWNLEDFEFSETYLFFWDAMEKSNTYLENVLATLDEPLDSRVFEAINYGPADDGGWWQMFADLVNKYGLVPKSAYPESANSKSSDAFKQYLNTKLREFASDLRDRHAAGTSLDELRALKNADMATVYRMCAIALGEPPERFDFLARTSDDKDDGKKKTTGEGPSEKAAKTGKDERPQIREFGITPMEFYKKYVPVDVNDLVTLCNVPMESRPFGKRYRIRFPPMWRKRVIWSLRTCLLTCSRRLLWTRSVVVIRFGSLVIACSSRCVAMAILIAIPCALTSFSVRNSRSTRPRDWSMAIAQAIMP